MELPDSPVKNPSRVPGILQATDAVGTAGGPGAGVTITPSMLFPPAGQRTEQETSMSERNDVITEDGVYEDLEKNRFQYRKDHQLAPGTIKASGLKKVGGYPSLGQPGEAELEATKAGPDDDLLASAKAKADAEEAERVKAEEDAKAKADADAKAAQDAAAKADAEPSNKKDQAPENKKS